jgi:hypothetical protein
VKRLHIPLNEPIYIVEELISILECFMKETSITPVIVSYKIKEGEGSLEIKLV